MSTTAATAQRISFLPFSAATAHRTLDLTDGDASLDLAEHVLRTRGHWQG